MLEFLGRLHVVVLHLPIGILMALGVLEIRAAWHLSPSPPVAWSLALLGSASAVVTAVFGVFLSWSGSYEPELLFRHQWLGIAVAVCSIVVFALKARETHVQAYRKALYFCLVLLVLGGHQGGSLTHGSDYLFLTATRETNAVDTSPAARVLETHCYECHGPTKRENSLRVDDRGALLLGGDSGNPAVVAGSAMKSELIRRITLPRDDEDAMPPDGRARLSADEMLFLIDWIHAGAPFESALAVAPASEELMRELVAVGIEIEPLSEKDHRLRASLGRKSARLADLVPVASNVAWLDLTGRRLADAEWSELARFENLTRLHLEHTNVEDRHLEHLANANQLEYLNLYGTNVGDDALLRLIRLPGLADVYLWQTRVSEDAVTRFLEMSPGVRVHRGASE